MSKSLVFGMLVIVCILVVAAGCTGQQAAPKAVVTPAVTIASHNGDTLQKSFTSLPKAPLNDTEKADIILMQEEGKLVYDLNTVYAQQHPDVPVFLSIAHAGKTYMDADDVILERYNIPNPETNIAGKFNNQKLQTMYDNGVNTGSMSVMNALQADAALADMHIADLTAAIGRTDNTDLQFFYQKELTFTENNLRALVSWITAYGGTYTPVYITQGAYNSIISTPAVPVTGQ
jgi:hypothetical protein